MDRAAREERNRLQAERLGCEVRRDRATLEWRWTLAPDPGTPPRRRRRPVDHEDCYTIWDLRFGLERWICSPRPSGRWTLEEVEGWLAEQEPSMPCPSSRAGHPCIAPGGLGHRAPHAWANPAAADSSSARVPGTENAAPRYDLFAE